MAPVTRSAGKKGFRLAPFWTEFFGSLDLAASGVIGRLHVHRLDVDELVDSVSGAFASEAGVLDPTERCSWVGTDIFVHKTQSRFELLRGDSSSPVEVRRDDARAKPELAVVRNCDRIRLVRSGDDCGDGPEHFLVVCRLAIHDIREDRRRVPGARPVRDFATEQQSRAVSDALLNLLVDLVARLHAHHRA